MKSLVLVFSLAIVFCQPGLPPECTQACDKPYMVCMQGNNKPQCPVNWNACTQECSTQWYPNKYMTPDAGTSDYRWKDICD